MAINDLLTRLERDAEDEAAATVARAEAEAEEILARANALIEQQRAAHRSVREAALRAEASREVGLARAEAARSVLEARHALLDRVFVAAASLLPGAVAGRDYVDRFPPELASALSCLPPGGGVVRCPAALAAKVTGAIRVDPDDSVGSGFVVGAADGSLTVDATLARQLERLRPALAAELIQQVDPTP